MSTAARPSTDCAGGLILDHGKVLLGLRSPESDTYPDVWDIFGGHVEPDETIEEALVRELREELDIIPTAFEYLSTVAEPDPAANGHCLYHIYKITSWSGPGPRLCGAEHTEVRWFTLADTLPMKLAMPEYRALLRDTLGPADRS